jgi:hypothetical protein
MSTNYKANPSCSAAGVTTASILVVMLAMGASTLFEASHNASAAAGGDASAQVVSSLDAAKLRHG